MTTFPRDITYLEKFKVFIIRKFVLKIQCYKIKKEFEVNEQMKKWKKEGKMNV